MAIPEQAFEPWYGREMVDMDPALVETMAQVREGLAATAVAHHAAQRQSAAFIVASGAAVLGGHSSVDPSPVGVNEAGTGPVFAAGTD